MRIFIILMSHALSFMRMGLSAYTPFGVPQTSTPDPFGFTGELHSQDLVYLRARWYDPSGGTFTSRDPFAGFPTRPYSLHYYQYGYSAPTVWTDASGLSPQKPSVLEGLYAQIVIQMHFLTQFPPPDGEIEFVVPKGSGRHPGSVNGFADMANRRTGEIYEIRHRDGQNALAGAQDSLQRYLHYLNQPGSKGGNTSRTILDPNIHQWSPGSGYGMPANFGLWPIGLAVDYNPFNDGFWVIKAEFAAPGVVLYWAEKIADSPTNYVYAPAKVQEFVREQYTGNKAWRRPDFGEVQSLSEWATSTNYPYSYPEPHICGETILAIGLTVIIVLNPVPGDEVALPVVWAPVVAVPLE